jgi:hypothetical protein
MEGSPTCSEAQLDGESVTRSSYACYQALWAVGGDPPLGLWRHGGLIKEFCRGRWSTPPVLPSVLAGLRKELEALSRLRSAVDSVAASISQTEATSGLDAVGEVFQLSARHTGWAL